uniref:Ig-like domain-containing protein n=1 Tax=Calidris pygmaea TaxID=425635 RepID=A0A8C3KB34_9CHAR
RTQMHIFLLPLLFSYFLLLKCVQVLGFRLVGTGRPLLVTVGQDIVLPCHLSPGVDARSLEIRWIRHQLSETVHLYRNGEDLDGAQMEEYIGRTELARDGLSNGSLDLRISGLRPSDDGQYVCTVQDAASYGEAIVDLEVAGLCYGISWGWCRCPWVGVSLPELCPVLMSIHSVPGMDPLLCLESLATSHGMWQDWRDPFTGAGGLFSQPRQ